jgi:hypothetical protein
MSRPLHLGNIDTHAVDDTCRHAPLQPELQRYNR